MGLEKFIIKQISKVAKNTIKIDNSLAAMEGKLVDEGLKVFDKSGINPSALPFDPVALAKGEISNPDSLLTPESICSTPPLTKAQKASSAKAVQNFNKAILNTVNSTNQLKQALTQIQQPLIALEVTGQSMNTIITLH